MPYLIVAYDMSECSNGESMHIKTLHYYIYL